MDLAKPKRGAPKVPMKRNIFLHNLKIERLKYTIPNFELSYLPSKMVRRLEPNLLRCDVSLCDQVCLYFATEEKFRG